MPVSGVHNKSDEENSLDKEGKVMRKARCGLAAGWYLGGIEKAGSTADEPQPAEEDVISGVQLLALMLKFSPRRDSWQADLPATVEAAETAADSSQA